MRPTIDKEIVLRVDPRTLSSHRGYTQSVLAPVQIRHDGVPSGTVYGTLVFDALLISALADSVARRLTARRSVLDLVRHANPWQAADEAWRHATSLRDLIDDVEFSNEIDERLMEIERLRGRPPAAVDHSGHPSNALLLALLYTLEKLESRGPEWARLGLECWPSNTMIPKGYSVSSARPPHAGRDMFAYCNQVYDIDYALDVLAERHVRDFSYTLLTRASEREVDVSDLLDGSGQPTLPTLSACAEAMVRGIVKISQVVPFIKRRIAEKRSLRIAVPSPSLAPGLLAAVHASFLALTHVDREFTAEELTEIALQATIHEDDPSLIARIVHAVALSEPSDGEDLIRSGPIVLTKSAARREGIAV